jgi:hypothetical protein
MSGLGISPEGDSISLGGMLAILSNHDCLCMVKSNILRGNPVCAEHSGSKWVGRYVSPFLQATKACRERRGIALLLFLELGTRRGRGVSIMPWLISIPGRDLVPIVQKVGWAPGPVWTGVENLAPTGIWSPDCVLPIASRYTDWATQPTLKE